jgi:arachidonate 15-lipoxygenase
VGDDGRFVTVDNLVDTVTLVIYQATAHHALTNFPLQNIELYVPALPLAMYQPPPTQASGATFEDWLAYFPPLEISIIQESLYFVIGTLHYTELGHYPQAWFVDHRVDEPLQAFRRRLETIEEEIARENLERPMPYIYLLPKRIPQSTNI